MFVGVVTLVKPIRFLGITKRAVAGVVFGSGLLIVVTAGLLPAPTVKAAGPHTRLDEFVPDYQFHEYHSIHINAQPGIVFQAVKDVTASEIHLFRVLTWLRSPHLGSARETILNPSPDKPILEVATHSGFMDLAEDRDRELVFGTVAGRPSPGLARAPQPEDFIRFNRPGYAKIAMNFRVEPTPDGGSLLTTETRVFAIDAGARRRFAPYWRVIYPGSALIRIMWLDAIKRRAERDKVPR